jgi:cell division transport system permease protein
MKHMATAFTAIRRSPYQTLSAVLLLTITFFVGYAFSLFLFSADHILKYFETRPQVTAFFKLDTSQENISSLETTMKAKPYVDRVQLISKEKALEIYREDNKKDPLLLELVTADILPASIEVSSNQASELPQIKKDLESAPGVEEVVYQQDVIDTLQTWTQSVRYLGMGSVGILGLTSFFLILVISGMKVVSKRRAIQIMRILGASRWYVNAPFIYEGIVYGILGSLLGFGLMYVGLLYLTPWLTSFLGSVPLLPFPPEVFAVQLGIGTLAGIVLGAFASFLAVQRMMRRF